MKPIANLDQVAAACRKWKVQRLLVFGSVARGTNGPNSDIDLLVELLPGAKWHLFDLLQAEEELGELFGMKADLIPIEDLKWVLRDRVIDEAQQIYAA